jgi:uncharacterized protein (TIGR04255 family)
MARIQSHLDRAPVTEALIDFQVRPRNGVDLEAVQALVNSIAGYASKGPIVRIETSWSVTKDDGTRNTSHSRELGVRLHSTDERHVLQARIDGFTLSRLEPYQTWELLVGEARRLWAVYLSKPPDVPEGLPQGVAGLCNSLSSCIQSWMHGRI